MWILRRTSFGCATNATYETPIDVLEPETVAQSPYSTSKPEGRVFFTIGTEGCAL